MREDIHVPAIETRYAWRRAWRRSAPNFIPSRYPLSRAQEAWAKSMEGHATGKIVVEMGEAEQTAE